MKTLLQINSVLNQGSTGRIVENIGKIALNNNWNSYIAHARGRKSNASISYAIGGMLDLSKHLVLTRLFDRHGFGSKRATIKLIKHIEEIKPHIIHLNNIHGYYLNIEVLFNFLSKSKIQVFWTLYDCWAFTGHCAYYDTVGCGKWKELCFDCPQKNKYPASIFVDNSRSNYIRKKRLFTELNNITLIVHSKWLKNQVKHSFLKNIPIVHIYNGIDTNSFYYRNPDSFKKRFNLENKFLILGVANKWSNRKGVFDIIRLAGLLKEDEVIILDGKMDKNIISTLPEKNVIYTGRADNIEELNIKYSAADVFINPTHEDNFPTVNIEAMACGTPVVTYKSGGSVEAIDSDTGVEVEIGNVNGLYKAISEIKENGKEFYKNKCIERVDLEFNSSIQYKKYIKLFNESIK